MRPFFSVLSCRKIPKYVGEEASNRSTISVNTLLATTHYLLSTFLSLLLITSPYRLVHQRLLSLSCTMTHYCNTISGGLFAILNTVPWRTPLPMSPMKGRLSWTSAAYLPIIAWDNFLTRLSANEELLLLRKRFCCRYPLMNRFATRSFISLNQLDLRISTLALELFLTEGCIYSKRGLG
jgi:hypothetical protein